jgi:competence protein ComGC
MDLTLKTIIIIIIVLLIILCMINYKKQENFTNDEAIQNVASLYNQAKLSVTDLTSTGISTLNTVNANGNLTSNGNALFKNGSWLPYTDGNNYITSPNNILRGGPTSIQGDLNVSGSSNLNTLTVNNGTTLNGVTNVGTLKASNGIKLGPWNIVGTTNGLYMFNDAMTGGMMLRMNGGAAMQAVAGTGPGDLYGYFNAYSSVCKTCWATPL